MLGPAAIAFMSSRVGGWIHRRLVWLDRVLLRISGGRVTVFGPAGVYFLVLTTTGRKSGRRHSVPLVYVSYDGQAIVVGSNYGQQHHPAWTANLLADPRATVEAGGETFDVVAEQVTGERYDTLFEEFIAVGRNYDAYRGRAGRDIRMFTLRRVS